MNHDYAKRHPTGKKNMWRKKLGRLCGAETKLGPFQDHPYPPKANILEKLY